MEPERFDDVQFRMVEEPGPPPRNPRRRRRLTIVAASAVIAAGGLAAGASALTGSGEKAGRTVPVGAPQKGVTYDADGVRMFDRDRPCRDGKGGHGDKRRSSRSSTFKY